MGAAEPRHRPNVIAEVLRKHARFTTAVVFVNFHSEALIVPRATSLLDQGFEVIVADNSNTFPRSRVRRLTMPGNEGFARACNRAVAALPPQVDAVCFHNPDVDAEPSVLNSLRARLNAQRFPGAVAPAERDGSRLRFAGYCYPSPHREALLGGRAALRTRSARPIHRRNLSLSYNRVYPDTVPASWTRHPGRRFPSGGLLMVSRAAHDAIGGFDERYFLYGEDLDYWHRLCLTPRTTEFRPELVIDHATSTGSPLGGAHREVLRWLGVELFAETFSPSTWRRMRLVHRLVLSTIAPACPELANRVVRLWQAEEAPSAVLLKLRPYLARGLAAASAP